METKTAAHLKEIDAILKALQDEVGLLRANIADDAVSRDYLGTKANGIWNRATEFKAAARAALKDWPNG